MIETMIDWQKLIDERNAWVEHNFPNTPSPDGSILGVIEELGELCHAALKSEQNIRGTKAQHVEDARDAIGDLTIYLLGIMNHVHRTPSEAIPPLRIHDPTWCLRTLSHEVGLVAINPTIYGCERVVHCLKTYCNFFAWDYGQIVLDTWARVKERDWIKYPKSGMPDVIPAPTQAGSMTSDMAGERDPIL